MSELLFKDARDYLKFEYELRRARRSAYSMRAFARDLSISASGLNDFLKGRVGMSEGRIEKLSLKLNWCPIRKDHFKDLVLARFDRNPGVRQSAMMRIRARTKRGDYKNSLDAFKIISDWYHLAIIELCSIKDDMNVSKLASELKLTSKIVNTAVKRLLKLEMLRETEDGLKPGNNSNYFGDEGQSQAVKTFHSQILDLAQQALHDNESHHHDSQSFIYSVPAKDVEKMLGEIRKSVLDTISRYACEPQTDCIQAISIQSFPIWRNPSFKELN